MKGVYKILKISPYGDTANIALTLQYRPMDPYIF